MTECLILYLVINKQKSESSLYRTYNQLELDINIRDFVKVKIIKVELEWTRFRIQVLLDLVRTWFDFSPTRFGTILTSVSSLQ